jgi:hypothetical protein
MHHRFAFIAGLVPCLLALLIITGPARAGELSDEARAAIEAVGGPFTADEFERFLTDLPTLPELTARGADAAPDAILPEEVVDTIRDLGWDEERFFYIYGHAVTVLSLDQMDRTMDLMRAQLAAMPAQEREAIERMMDDEAQGDPMAAQLKALRDEVDGEVPASEQALVLENAARLREALGIPDEL